MPESFYEDPVVSEVHAIRAKMLADCGGDFHKLMENVRQHQKASGRTIIQAPAATPREKTSPARVARV